MKLGDFLNTQAVQSGVQADNEALKKVLSNVQLMDYDLPDELAGKISSSLLTVEAAKNNPEVKKHYFAQSLNGVDSEINTGIAEFQLSEDAKNEILAEKSSTKRVILLAKKVKELEAGKAGATEGKKNELTEKINLLNTEIATLKSSTVPKATYDEEVKKFNSRLIDRYQNDVLSSKKFAADAYKEDGYLLPKSKIQKALEEKKLRVVLDNDKLKLETTDGTVYFENNKAIDFETFTDSVLAQNKYTAVSGTPPPAANPGGFPPPTPQIKNKAAVMSEIKAREALQDLNTTI